MATTLRPFAPEDIPVVVSLRRRSFQRSHHSDDGALAGYFRTVFFENPWADPEFAGLVCESDGELAGFVGLIPRPMRLGNRKIWGAIATQFMVAPEHRGVPGIMIMRALFGGRQDLLVADAGSAAGEKMWCGLGGAASPGTRFQWSRTLRPGRLALAKLGGRLPGAGVMAPLGSVLDRVGARLFPARFGVPDPEGEREPLDSEEVATLLPGLVGAQVVHPVYSGPSLQWLLDRIGDKYESGALRATAVRRAGRTVGWFMYARHAGGAVALQLASRPEDAQLIADHLVADAWHAGLTSVEGRVQPEFADALTRLGATFEPRGSGIHIHSRHPELVRQVLGGNAFLTALEGEWWLAF
jgi:hypothetical protein